LMPEGGVLERRELFRWSLEVARWDLFVSPLTPRPVAGFGRIPLSAYDAGVVWFVRISTRGPLRDFIGEWLVGMDGFKTGSVAKSIDILSVEGPP